MNRLFYSNIAIQQLSSAQNNKFELLRLDRELSSIQTNIFIMKLKNKDRIGILQLQFEAQRVEYDRNNIISAIANNIYMSIDNAIKAMLLSMQGDNYSLIMLDDHMFQNIASFISEYYKDDEIKHAIKDRIRFSLISYNMIQLGTSQKYVMPGLMNLQNTLR